MTNFAMTRTGFLADFSDSIAHAFGDFRVAQQKRASLRKTRRELNALSARELEDLGLSRGDIERVSYEAVYGPLV